MIAGVYGLKELDNDGEKLSFSIHPTASLWTVYFPQPV